MKSRDNLSRYLADTYEIGEITEQLDPLDPEENDAIPWLLAPWSVESIAINTGMEVADVLSLISTLDGASLENAKIGNMSVQILKLNSLPALADEVREYRIPSNLRVSQAMNLHVYQYLKEKCSQTKRPQKIEDALFDLKNGVFLPDDFMPEYLMEMVEGSLTITIEDARKSLQVIDGADSIYIYPEKKANGLGRVRFLYPAKSFDTGLAISNDKIRNIIGSSFKSLQARDDYREFENSRIVKNAIFNLEQKKSRELRKPMFDPRKIAVLEKMGIAVKVGDNAMLKDAITLEQLNEVYLKAKDTGINLAKEWLSSGIELGN